MENKLSLTKKEMDYLMNGKKIANKAKFFNALLVCASIALGAGGFAIYNFAELLSPIILGLSSTSLGVMWFGSLFGKLGTEKEKKACDKVLERVKLIAQQQCPKRLINGSKFQIVRRNNEESNLSNYTFEQKLIHSADVKTIDKVEREDLQIGTISTQFIISDKNGVIGAIEEIQTNDVERKPTKDGSSESVVSTFTYKRVPSNEIRTPYEDADKKIQQNGIARIKKQNNKTA